MATTASALPLPRSQAPARWHTLRVLQTARVLLFAIDALLLLALVTAVRLHRDAIHTVGLDTAPSIVAAQSIKASIAAMDAEVATELLGSSGEDAPSLINFDATRQQAAGSLVAAAENITYGEAERGPIRTLENGLAVYEDLVQRARDLRDGESRGEQRDQAGSLTAFHEAETMTDRSLLPAADDLDRANLTEMERTYGRERLLSGFARLFVVVAGLLTTGGLLWMQIWLSRRTRRTLNMGLLLATMLSLGMTVGAMAALNAAQEQLRVAKEDAFTSVHALWQARAVAFEAESDEGRLLLDPERAPANQRAFAEHAAAMAQLPPGTDASGVIAAATVGERMPVLGGFLGDELNNVTFPGERRAALDTLSGWERWVQMEAAVRRLAGAGQHREAVNLFSGGAEGQGGWAFREFDRALGDTLAINQRYFERAVQDGLADLGGLDGKLIAAALAVGALVFFGLAPRIREYQ